MASRKTTPRPSGAKARELETPYQLLHRARHAFHQLEPDAGVHVILHALETALVSPDGAVRLKEFLQTARAYLNEKGVEPNTHHAVAAELVRLFETHSARVSDTAHDADGRQLLANHLGMLSAGVLARATEPRRWSRPPEFSSLPEDDGIKKVIERLAAKIGSVIEASEAPTPRQFASAVMREWGVASEVVKSALKGT